MQNLKFSTLISEDQIRKRITEMGTELTEKFKDKDVIAICVLRGSFVFYSDLIREIDADIICDFFGVASYHTSMKSSGEIKLTLDLASPVEDKHLILVEDIVDSGLTMAYLQKNIKARNPASLTTVTLLHKPSAKKVDCEIDYVGFKIENEFVVGYGLDYQNNFRNLPYIARIENLN